MRLRTLIQALLFTVLVGTPLLACCDSNRPLLEHVKETGFLLVATRDSPTTYFEGPRGMAGLEHDLVMLFAESIGVEPLFVVLPRFEDILPSVQQGVVHIAAAGLTITPERERLVRFGPAYQEITPQVVYKIGTNRPRSVQELIGRSIEIVAGSSHETRIDELTESFPELTWVANRELESDELLYRVKEESLELTVADSNEVALNRRYYPQIGVAFDLSEPESLGWALQHSEDDSLVQAVREFFEQIKADGRLDQIVERYYGFVEEMNIVDSYLFQRYLKERLPAYRPFFEQAGKVTGLDWKLLAAIGYQESHWNPEAVSPTGVRGMMMLTELTAKELGVSNRQDPEQSILGGARYLERLVKKIPERIKEPDRIWLALAGYNVGFGHLEDARVITNEQGEDWDRWSNVKKWLPVLRKKKWYSKTRYGYARGREPVDFVDSIRNYYDLLNRVLDQDGQDEDIKRQETKRSANAEIASPNVL